MAPHERYDVLLDDYEPQTTTAEVRTLFDELKPQLVELIAELRRPRRRRLVPHGDFPPDRQRALAHEVSTSSGTGPTAGGIDPTEHPFASGPGRDDVRITTHYHPDTSTRSSRRCTSTATASTATSSRSISSGSRPAARARSGSTSRRAGCGRTSSVAAGRSGSSSIRACRRRTPSSSADVELERFLRRASTRSKPGLIRIDADEVTYGMHVMLRFELEQDIVEGRVELKRPAAGLEPEDVGLPRRRGARRRARRPPGRPLVRRDRSATSRRTCIGTVASVQIWEAVLRDVPDLEEQVGRGEFAALREWLGEHVHDARAEVHVAGDAAARDRLDAPGAAVPRLPPHTYA